MPTPESILHLTDEQANAVFAAAHPLEPNRRSAFLEEVAREIARLPEVGDGLLYRLIVQIQKKHFDAPQFNVDSGSSSRSRRRVVADDEDDRPRRRAQQRPRPPTMGMEKPPIRLSDSELAAVFAAARPLDVRCRDAFLQSVAGILAGCLDPGPGDVYRAILVAQRRHYDPPQFDSDCEYVSRRAARGAAGVARYR